MSLLPETTSRLDDIIARAQASTRAPSLVVAVLRDGVTVYASSAGDSVDGGPAPGPDVQYRIGSISKTMTSALVMQLRDEGRLQLDDPLERHLPGSAAGDRTLRQLLGHVSGLQREPDGQWWERSAGADLPTLVGTVGPDKLARAPYLGFHYSNLAYGLLGGVLSRITGTGWADLVADRLLKPLGMTRTSYHPAEPFARGYVVHPWHQTLREEPRLDAVAMAPAGQLWSTAADLGRWAAFLADPDPAVLGPATVAEMCAPVVITDLESWQGGYGLGIELYRSGDRVYAGHGGSMPGYLAILMTHRSTRTAVVAFSNVYNLLGSSIGELGQALLDAVLDGEPAPAPAPWLPAAAPPPAIAALCGRWWWMGREFQVGWDAAAGELVMAFIGSTVPVPWRFAAEGTDRWRGRSGMNDGEVLLVRRGADGEPEALDIATFVFTRTPD